MPVKIHGEVKRINGKRVASPEYRSWQMMLNRCENPRAVDYKYYGGRGIKVSARWHKFEEFLADMGRRPTRAFTLERKNNNAHYEKRNCCWATRQEQSRNRDYTKLTIIDARAVRYLYKVRRRGLNRQKDIAKLYGVSQRTISLIVRHEAWREGEGAI